MLPKVLIVEDFWPLGDTYKLILRSVCEVLFTDSQEEARELFEKNKAEIAVIVVDACVPGTEPNTHNLVKHFRSEFDGSILVSSSDPDFAAEIIAVGADEAVEKGGQVTKRVEEILTTQQQKQ